MKRHSCALCHVFLTTNPCHRFQISPGHLCAPAKAIKMNERRNTTRRDMWSAVLQRCIIMARIRGDIFHLSEWADNKVRMESGPAIHKPDIVEMWMSRVSIFITLTSYSSDTHTHTHMGGSLSPWPFLVLRGKKKIKTGALDLNLVIEINSVLLSNFSPGLTIRGAPSDCHSYPSPGPGWPCTSGYEND